MYVQGVVDHEEVVLFGCLLSLFIYCVVYSNVLTMMANPSYQNPSSMLMKTESCCYPPALFIALSSFELHKFCLFQHNSSELLWSTLHKHRNLYQKCSMSVYYLIKKIVDVVCRLLIVLNSWTDGHENWYNSLRYFCAMSERN